MLEISFQMDQRKETLINSYGERKECDLLYITSLFMHCFYPLLKGCQTGKLPDSYQINKSHNKFLRCFRSFWGGINPRLSHLDEKYFERKYIFPEYRTEKFTFDVGRALDRKPENIVLYTLEITEYENDDLAASLWLESIMMYCAVYYWLSPKVVGKSKKGGESRRKPTEMLADTEISSFNRSSEENKIIHAVLKKMEKQPEYSESIIGGVRNFTCPFSPPLLGELLIGILSWRIKAVQMDMDIRYPVIPRDKDPHGFPYSKLKEKRPERAYGRKYKANTILQLAWVEIMHAIEHDIYVNTCEFCGKPLVLHKQYTKRLCGSKKCKRLYDHRQGQLRKVKARKKLHDHIDKKSEVGWKSS